MSDFGFSNSYWGSNVPADVPAPQDIEVEHYCPDNHMWVVVMDNELGGIFYYHEDADPYCPECGKLYDRRY